MRRNNIIFQMILAICMAVFYGQTISAVESDPLIGKKAPTISGKDAAGKGLLRLNSLMTEIGYERDEKGELKEVDGKYVLQVTKNILILNFFSKTCIPCMREIPTFNRMAEVFSGKPVKLVYVNVDPDVDMLDMRRFMARKGIRVPMMMPNQREAIRKYNVLSLPRLVVIDRQGKIVEIITGFHEDLEQRMTRLISTLLNQ